MEVKNKMVEQDIMNDDSFIEELAIQTDDLALINCYLI